MMMMIMMMMIHMRCCVSTRLASAYRIYRRPSRTRVLDGYVGGEESLS